jgi:hypothetical protein
MGSVLQTYDGNGNLISTVDTRVVSDMVSSIQDSITNYRDNNILDNATVWFNGYEYDCDPVSRQNIAGVVTYILAGQTLPSNFAWRDFFNNNNPQNNLSMMQFGILVANYVEVVYGTSWALKSAVAAIAAQSLDEATIKAQLDAFDITADWPTNDLTPSVAHNY